MGKVNLQCKSNSQTHLDVYIELKSCWAGRVYIEQARTKNWNKILKNEKVIR